MRFWDASAILPLLVEETTTAAITALLREDTEIVAWWATETECVSAIARLEREGALTGETANDVLRRLDAMRHAWNEVQPVPSIRVTARRLLRVHTLRAADALQLSAAVITAEHDPSTLEVVCLDDRLRSAAEKEGFVVLPKPSR